MLSFKKTFDGHDDVTSEVNVHLLLLNPGPLSFAQKTGIPGFRLISLGFIQEGETWATCKCEL